MRTLTKSGWLLALAMAVFGCSSAEPEPNSNVVKPGDPGYVSGETSTDAGKTAPATPSENQASEN